jgi:ureidoglycolate lyase
MGITIEHLVPERFSAFGWIIEHDGRAGRCYHPQVLSKHAAQFWLNNPKEQLRLPYAMTRLERHPYSTQCFLPLTGARYLAVACPSRTDGTPDGKNLCAFDVCAPTGIAFREGVWHHGLLVYDTPANFAVIMGNGARTETEFFEMTRNIQLVEPLHATR